MARKAITKKTRFEVFKRDSFACTYCGSAAPAVVLVVDHIQPVAKGGDNDILNLVTACQPCNAGKSDRLLSDDSAVTKQKAQLDELNIRREQLEMMLEWRSGLKDLAASECDAAVDEWANLSGYYFNEIGRRTIQKHIKKFGLKVVLDSMQIAADQYLDWDGDQCTGESAETALKKLGGICRMTTLPEWKQRIYHIRNIARLRSGQTWYPQTSAEILALFEQAYNEGDTLEQLYDLAGRGLKHADLRDALGQWINESRLLAAVRREQEEEDRAANEREERILAVGQFTYPDAAMNAFAIDELMEAGEMQF